MDRNKALLGVLAVVGLAYLVCPRPAPPQSKTLPTYLQPIPKWNERTIPQKPQTLLRPQLQSPQKPPLNRPVHSSNRFYNQRFQSARAESSRLRNPRLQSSRRISEIQRKPASQLGVPAVKKTAKTLRRNPASRAYTKLSSSKSRLTVASSARR